MHLRKAKATHESQLLLSRIPKLLQITKDRRHLAGFSWFVDNKLVLQTGQSIKELFIAVRQDLIYTTTKRSEERKNNNQAKVAEPKKQPDENEEDGDESLVLQPMAQPPEPSRGLRRSDRK